MTASSLDSESVLLVSASVSTGVTVRMFPLGTHMKKKHGISVSIQQTEQQDKLLKHSHSVLCVFAGDRYVTLAER